MALNFKLQRAEQCLLVHLKVRRILILVGETRKGRDRLLRNVSSKKKAPNSDQDSSYAVGDRVKVNLHTGRIVDATVKAIIERTGGKRLQVDFGKDETALVHLWQVIEKVR